MVELTPELVDSSAAMGVDGIQQIGWRQWRWLLVKNVGCDGSVVL